MNPGAFGVADGVRGTLHSSVRTWFGATDAAV
jgi:hypothetical protein